MIGLHRRAAALALACLLVVQPMSAWAIDLLPEAGQASGASSDHRRTLTLDDVLSMETFGTVALSPDGRWLAHEKRRSYDTAPRFDRAHRSGWEASDLFITPTEANSPPEPLVASEPETGLLLGSWSPDSRRLLIYRLSGDRLEAGIVTVADRSVRWTGLTPDLPITGAASAWLDNDRLALTIRPAGDLPWMLRFDGTGKAEMDRRWQRTINGREPSRNRVETHGGLITTDAVPPRLQLVILDVTTGARRPIADGNIRDMVPSPAGDRIAVLTSAERAPQDPSGIITQSAVQTRSRVTLIDVPGGEVTEPTEVLDIAPNLMRWSPDGQAVLVWARTDTASWRDARLISVGSDGVVRRFETGDLLPLAADSKIDELQAVQADWLDGSPIFRARRPDSDRFDWWRIGDGAARSLTGSFAAAPAKLAATAEDSILAFAEGRLWRIDSRGAPQAVAGAADNDAEALRDGRTYTLMDAARPRVNEAPRRRQVMARSNSAIQLIDEAGAMLFRASLGGCDGALQGRSVVASGIATVCLDQGVETLRLATSTTDRLVDRANPGFADIAVPKPVAVPHRDRLGRETTSWLFLPPGVPADRVRGLLVHVYPDSVNDGRYVEATSLAIGLKPQLLAAAGYAVLSASIPAETESLRAEMIDDFTRSADLAVDAALAAMPSLPAERMAVVGHSFGGYTALAIATRSHRFRSYVSWAGPSDMAGGWGEFGPHIRTWPEDRFTLDQPIGATEVGQAGMGGPPWADVSGYAAASPYMLADKIEAPMLLITADRDYVPMTEAERMLTALHRQGKWARLVTYWGETHSNASPANVHDVYREIFDWLDRTLAPETVTSPTAAAPMPEPSPRSPPPP